MNKKLWGGRFSETTHPDVDQYNASIITDQELAWEDLLGNVAHAKMLAHCKIITEQEYQQIHAGLSTITQMLVQNRIEFDLADEDIHMNIERILTEIVGDTAKKIHTARSRNDQVALDMHLYARKQILAVHSLIYELQTTLLAHAHSYQEVILPGYTHLQRAQPISLAQHFLAYVFMLQRDIARLQNLWPQVNQSPLGAAALAGTTFSIDRNYLAELLQFDGIYHNSLDAVSNRDYIIEFLNANALIMMHLSRFCEELILWSSQEFNFIQFSDAFTTGSSIMPQKKNPDIAELARGKTGRVYGSLFNLFTIMKSLPLAYNKDLQEDKEPFFDSIKTVKSTLAIFNSMLKAITINENKMRAAVVDGFLNATDLADYLVNKGLSFREAHHIAGQLVAVCIKENCSLENLALTTMQSCSNLITDDVYQFIDLKACVNKRNSDGGTGKLSIQKQLQQAKDILSNNVVWLEQKQKLLTKAEELLTSFA